MIIPAVLIMIAAVAVGLFLALKPVTITASGTVLDRRTGQPITTARLYADGKSARTNARGVFRLRGLSPGARLRIQARYYATARVTAASTALRVRLAPIPVHVAVTSALTGNPLTALVSASARPAARAPADGAVTLYLTGTGQALSVTADGYRPGRAMIGQDDTATIALDPTRPTMSRQLWAWADSGKYRAIAGWALHLKTGVSLPTGAQFNQPGQDSLTANITTGYIDSDGTSVSFFIARPGVRWDTPNTPVVVFGTSLRPVMLAEYRAWHGGPGEGRQFVTMWSSDPVSVITSGSSQAKADALMTSIIKAMT